jgi:hypothetical protein
MEVYRGARKWPPQKRHISQKWDSPNLPIRHGKMTTISEAFVRVVLVLATSRDDGEEQGAINIFHSDIYGNGGGVNIGDGLYRSTPFPETLDLPLSNPIQ